MLFYVLFSRGQTCYQQITLHGENEVKSKQVSVPLENMLASMHESNGTSAHRPEEMHGSQSDCLSS